MAFPRDLKNPVAAEHYDLERYPDSSGFDGKQEGERQLAENDQALQPQLSVENSCSILRVKESRRSAGTLLLSKGLPEKGQGLFAISYFPPYLFFPNALKDVAHDRAGFISQPHHIPSRDEGRGAYDVSPFGEDFDSVAQLNQFLVLPG